MTTTTLDRINVQIAALGPATPRAVPTDLGYGVDLDCVTDTTPALTEVRPQSPHAIGQAVLRRLITPRGAVLDAPDYGYDVRGRLNHGTTTDDIRSMESDVRGEAMKDDRVTNADVTVTYVATTRALTVELIITPADPTRDDFNLVFYVTADAVQLIASIDNHG
jgi:hypothetical protein